MSLFSWLGISVFGIWGIASLLVQWSNDSISTRYSDLRHFVSRWSFFSPAPGEHDFYLLFRSKFKNGEIGPWTSAGEPESRKLIHAIWHPDMRRKKALIGAVKLLSAEGYDEIDAQKAKTNTGYLSILSSVMAVPGPSLEVARQFMVLRKSGIDREAEPELIILSDFFAPA